MSDGSSPSALSQPWIILDPSAAVSAEVSGLHSHSSCSSSPLILWIVQASVVQRVWYTQDANLSATSAVVLSTELYGV